jgi:hypothetical protein
VAERLSPSTSNDTGLEAALVILATNVRGTLRLGNRIFQTEIPPRDGNDATGVPLVFSEILEEEFQQWTVGLGELMARQSTIREEGNERNLLGHNYPWYWNSQNKK